MTPSARARGHRGKGTVEERDGKWWWRRSGNDSKGVRRRWREGPFESKAAAEAERDRLGNATNVDAETVTWQQWFDIWTPEFLAELETHQQDGYAEFVERVVRLHLAPGLTGRMAVTTPSDLNELWKLLLSRDLAHSYVTNMKAVLSRATKAAQAHNPPLLLSNPVALSRIPKPTLEDRDLQIVHPDEVISLALYAELRRWLILECKSKWALPTLIAGETGARRGEVLGLQPVDLKAASGKLRIDRQVLKPKSKPRRLGPPKWGSSRVLSIDSALVARLQERALEVERSDVKTRLFFHNGEGGLADVDQWTRWFTRVVRPRFDLPDGFTLHSLRHTHASILLMSGKWSDVAVAERLGHKDSVITRRIYTHFIDDPTDGIGDGWAAMFD